MKIAAFIDCENIPASYAGQIFSLFNETGKLVFCQGYADFSNPYYRGWQDPLSINGVRTVQVYHNTKDNADSEILIDATECAIKERKIDAICIVSNDGIYTALKRIVHGHNKAFLVVGTNLSNRILEDSADTFFRLDGTDSRAATATDIINDTLLKNGGSMRLSNLGNAVWGLLPNYKALGFKNMQEYIASLGFLITEDTAYSPPISWAHALTVSP